MINRRALLSSLALLPAVQPQTAIAQQITGVPGALSATIKTEGKQIPASPITFGREFRER
jgi:hypothetical protein